MIRGVGPYSALITPKPGHSSTLFSTEAEDIGTLFPETRRKAREVAVRRDETETVEPTAV